MKLSTRLFVSLMVGLIFVFFTLSLPAQTINDSAPGASYYIVHQIGRFDVSGVFHGTDYNFKKYSTADDCTLHYDETVDEVRSRAADKGASLDVQEEHANRFKALYKCQEITVDAHHSTMRDLDKAAVQPKPFKLAPLEDSGYAASVNRLRQLAPPLPTKPYYIAQYVDNVPGYRPGWVRNAVAYPTIASCQNALRQTLDAIQAKINARYEMTQKDEYATAVYANDLRRFRMETVQRFQCVG